MFLMSYGSNSECAVFPDLGEGFTYPEHVSKLSRKFSRDTQSQKLPPKNVEYTLRRLILPQNILRFGRVFDFGCL